MSPSKGGRRKGRKEARRRMALLLKATPLHTHTGKQTRTDLPMATLVRGGRECVRSWVSAARSSSRLVVLPSSRSRPPLHLSTSSPCQQQQRPASASSVSKSSSTMKREGKTTEHRVMRVVPFTCEQLFGKFFNSREGSNGGHPAATAPGACRRPRHVIHVNLLSLQSLLHRRGRGRGQVQALPPLLHPVRSLATDPTQFHAGTSLSFFRVDSYRRHNLL